MFPQSRDARRELGITYYQQNDNKAALEQFEALQQIDPDDLTAHYNLSILYRRMGKPKEAAEQQAMFVDKKVDPGAPTYSLNYLRAFIRDIRRKASHGISIPICLEETQ
jgi:tetratricopeptide (TPR) repeat protein